MTDTLFPPLGKGSYPTWWHPKYVPSVQEWKNLWSQKADYNDVNTAGFIKSLTYGDNNRFATDVLNLDGSGGLYARAPNNTWYKYLPYNATVQAIVISDRDARPTTIRTFKNGFNGHPELLVQNDNFDEFRAPSTAALQDEISRAQAAEAKLVQSVVSPGGHDTRIDNVVWNHDTQLYGIYVDGIGWKQLYPIEQSIRTVTISDNDVLPTTIRTFKNGFGGHPELLVQNDNFDEFRAPSTAALQDEISRAQSAETQINNSVNDLKQQIGNTSGGNVSIPGVSGPVKIQAFRIVLTLGKDIVSTPVTFPEAFNASDPTKQIQIFYTLIDWGSGNLVWGAFKTEDITNKGFNIRNWLYNDTYTLSIIVIGPK